MTEIRSSNSESGNNRLNTFSGVVGSSLAVKYSDYVPAQPEVVEYSHSAKIIIDPKDVPAGTDRVHIEAKEINDLTGDRFEQGYSYGYK